MKQSPQRSPERVLHRTHLARESYVAPTAELFHLHTPSILEEASVHSDWENFDEGRLINPDVPGLDY